RTPRRIVRRRVRRSRCGRVERVGPRRGRASRYVPRSPDAGRAPAEEVAMPVEPVPTPSAPPAAGPYSPAVRAGEWLVLAGQVGLDPATGRMVDGGVDAQARQVLANMAAVLRDCGASLADVAKTTVFVTDIAEF